MPKDKELRIKVEVPLFFDIEVAHEADNLCGYECPQWEEDKPEEGDMRAVCRIFGRLRWMDAEMSYRHKNCMAAKVVKRRKK